MWNFILLFLLNASYLLVLLILLLQIRKSKNPAIASFANRRKIPYVSLVSAHRQGLYVS